MAKEDILKDYFQVGHLYEVTYNKLSQIKENGGIIKRIFVLKHINPYLSKDMLFEDIQNGEEQYFYYEEYNVDTLKKIS
jgi:hypothetical protein